MTIDSNILIGYLDGDISIIEALKSWRDLGVSLFLPTMTESEVLAFAHFSPNERAVTERFLEENFISVPFDRSIARIAAGLRRETKIKFPDAAIAATALFTHTPIVTRNIKDFQRISHLQIVHI